MLAIFQLLRLPTVFTAMADIVLGFVLTHGCVYGPQRAAAGELVPKIGWNEPGPFFGLMFASCCLYLSGMVFNDLFDRKQDSVERPGRPIPSGRISVKFAFLLGTSLILIGLGFASAVGVVSLEIASLLVVAILGYDGVLKKTLLGPIAMGGCRFLNVMLGASAYPDVMRLLFSQPQLAAATGLGVFIVGVTLFARTEAGTSNRWHLRFAQLVLNFGFSILIALVMMTVVDSPKEVPLTMLFVVAFTTNRRVAEAIEDPSPSKVQGGVKAMLLSYVVLDSTLIFWWLNTQATAGYGTIHAFATAALVIPAMVLARYIPMT